MNSHDKLKEIFVSIYKENLSYAQTVELVKTARTIVTVFLKNKKKEAILFAYKNGIDFNDLVTDIVAESFELGPDNKLKNLSKFISFLKVPILTIQPQELFWAFYSYMTKFASINLARLYATHDPNGHKIRKNITETITLLGKFDIIKTNGETVYCAKDYTINKLNYMPYELMEPFFLSSIKTKKTTRELLEVIYSMIEHQEDFRKEIRLNDVIRLFKSYYGYKEEPLTEIMNSFEAKSDISEKYEVEQICNKALERIKEKVYVDYFAKGKLTREQAIGLVNSINDIVFDWIEFGSNELTYFEYLAKHLVINKSEYELQIKAKLEYLIKEVKKIILLYIEN